MMRVFLFKSNARGMQYGVGTYIRTLTGALLEYSKVEIFLVSYMCADIQEVQVHQLSDRQTNISIPAPNQPFEPGEEADKKYAVVVAHLLEDWLDGGILSVFHFNSFNGLPLLLRLKEKYPYPVVGVVHSAQWQTLFNGNKKKLAGLNVFEPSTDVEYTLSLERKFYESCDRVVSVTQYMKDFLTGYYGIDSQKVEVIPNGIEPVNQVPLSLDEKATLKRTLGFRAEDRILLFVGRIEESKGIFALLDAFSQVCRLRDNVRLVIAGEGQISECLRRNHVVKGRLTFTGFLSPVELEDYYRIADAGIIPSLYDHCPYSLLEMAAHKIPMIVSKIDGLTEMLSPDRCRFVDVNVADDGETGIAVSSLSVPIQEVLHECSVNVSAQNQYIGVISETFTNRSMGLAYLRSYRQLYDLKY